MECIIYIIFITAVIGVAIYAWNTYNEGNK